MGGKNEENYELKIKTAAKEKERRWDGKKRRD